MLYVLDQDPEWFPDPTDAEPEGLLAVGGDLSPQRLVAAYRRGIFPWYGPDLPILWFSPDPRFVLFPRRLRVNRSLRKTLRREPYEITLDTAFADVIEACATVPRPDGNGTWIVPDMVDAYCRLHELGLAHSVEAWTGERLVGGAYGVALGGAFFGESMFALEPDASKIAFVHLVRQLERWGFAIVDCQMHTPHLERFGAEDVSRLRFLSLLADALERPHQAGGWAWDRG